MESSEKNYVYKVEDPMPNPKSTTCSQHVLQTALAYGQCFYKQIYNAHEVFTFLGIYFNKILRNHNFFQNIDLLEDKFTFTIVIQL